MRTGQSSETKRGGKGALMNTGLAGLFHLPLRASVVISVPFRQRDFHT
jgi:hypothetical protein